MYKPKDNIRYWYDHAVRLDNYTSMEHHFLDGTKKKLEKTKPFFLASLLFQDFFDTPLVRDLMSSERS